MKMQLEDLIKEVPKELLAELEYLSEIEQRMLLKLFEKNPDYFRGGLSSNRNIRLVQEETKDLGEPQKNRVKDFYDRAHLYRAFPQIASEYIKHYRKRNGSSISFIGFFERFNPTTRRINESSRSLQKYITIYLEKAQDEGTTFLEFVSSFLPTILSRRLIGTLIERGENAPRDYSIEDGLQAYIRHYEHNRENSTTLGEFFRTYSPITLEKGLGTRFLMKHYINWYTDAKDKHSDFELYLLEKANPETKERLEEIRSTLANNNLDPRTVELLKKAAEEYLLS